ncbi:MAG: UDP-N-acetylglucosamine diphosphorylase [Oscillospiraceae bacterium]|jgi:bifunctional UDP-N-acetylglucosamine pyrophosphorylase/glucosamine-1-phosphate N-acetyltransferase|nr:UDP-N-acetylglucosamine diphosphorylase [Oscillospiraceae bacterium]
MDASQFAMEEKDRAAALAALRAAGVRIPCADGVVVTGGVQVGAGTLILPGSILCGNTVIGEHCVIGPNSVLCDTTVGSRAVLNNVQSEGAEIGADCEIGPWVRLRPGTKLGQRLRIGNFVELKNANIGDATKIAHLSYIGDADFGKAINVGCGLAVANYDGKQKHRAQVGDGAFIGCHNSLVAPVSVGPGAYTAAGSVITEDVPAGGFAVARARQVNKEGRGQR